MSEWMNEQVNEWVNEWIDLIISFYRYRLYPLFSLVLVHGPMLRKINMTPVVAYLLIRLSYLLSLACFCLLWPSVAVLVLWGKTKYFSELWVVFLNLKLNKVYKNIYLEKFIPISYLPIATWLMFDLIVID